VHPRRVCPAPSRAWLRKDSKADTACGMMPCGEQVVDATYARKRDGQSIRRAHEADGRSLRDAHARRAEDRNMRGHYRLVDRHGGVVRAARRIRGGGTSLDRVKGLISPPHTGSSSMRFWLGGLVGIRHRRCGREIYCGELCCQSSASEERGGLEHAHRTGERRVGSTRR
jgi:hypothetical protein